MICKVKLQITTNNETVSLMKQVIRASLLSSFQLKDFDYRCILILTHNKNRFSHDMVHIVMMLYVSEKVKVIKLPQSSS